MAKEDKGNSSSKKEKAPKKRSFSLSKAKKKNAKKSTKSKASKGNPVTGYLKGAYSELKKVSWPDRTESIRLTIGVIIYSLAFALFIALVDYIFDVGFERFIV